MSGWNVFQRATGKAAMGKLLSRLPTRRILVGSLPLPLDELQCLLHLFSKKDFHERLVRHISFVGQQFDAFQQWLRKANRDSLAGRLKIWEKSELRLRPIDVICRVVPGPKILYFLLWAKLWQLLEFFQCTPFFPSYSCRAPRSRELEKVAMWKP